MSILRNIRISLKLYATFAVLLGLMVALGLISVNRFSQLAGESTGISGNMRRSSIISPTWTPCVTPCVSCI